MRILQKQSHATIRTCLLLLVGLLAWGAADAQAEVDHFGIAVLAHQGVDNAYAQWQPTADYLSARIPRARFFIQPVDNDNIAEAIASGKVQFVLTNAVSYAALEQSQGITRFATMLKGRQGDGHTRFGAAIFTRADRDDIKTLADLRGRSFMAVHPNAYGGWWMAWRELKDAGIDPQRDLRELLYSGFPQQKVVDAVLDGTVDAGTVRAETLAVLARQGSLDLSGLRLLQPRQDPGYPIPHSTRLYPDWPFAAAADTPRHVVEQVLVALFDIDPESAPAVAAGIRGWTVPLEYAAVHELMRELEVGPYARTGRPTLKEVIRELWPAMAVAAVVFLGALALTMTLMHRQVTRHRNSLRQTLISIGDAVVTMDAGGVVDLLNAPARGFAREGVDPKHARFSQLFDLREPASQAPIHIPDPGLVGTEEPRSRTAQLVIDGGAVLDVKVTVTPVDGDAGKASGWVVVIHDITNIQDLARRLRHQATHDELTGLVNRRELERRVKDAIEDARLNGGSHALCYLDLDQFKFVNDTSGHVAGDALLRRVAARLRAQVRSNDTIGRLGGDEFGILLESCSPQIAVRIAEKVRAALETYRLHWERRVFETGASIGVAVIDESSAGLDEVMRQADAACFAAKEQGRNRVHLYDSSDRVIASHGDAMRWAQRIGDALDRDAFFLEVQPLVGISPRCRGQVVHEVLLRMRDDQDRGVLPSAFLAAAERFNLVERVDRWVVSHALQEIGKVHAARAAARFSINLSGQTLGDVRFGDFVEAELQRYGVDPKALCFEVTESAVIASLDTALGLMRKLRELGCGFALDDFGSGLGSFGYLREMPANFLKIDGGIVQRVVADPVARAMVEAAKRIADTLEVETIAEMVTADEVLDALRAIGIDYAQGYGITRPFAFSEVLERGFVSAGAGTEGVLAGNNGSH